MPGVFLLYTSHGLDILGRESGSLWAVSREDRMKGEWAGERGWWGQEPLQNFPGEGLLWQFSG